MNHREAWDMIPWLVNGSIHGADRERLDMHVAGCSECCEELQAQRELLLAMRSRPQVEAMPHASLQKLWARLDADSLPRTGIAAPAAAAPRQLSRTWLVASCACAALLLGATLLIALNPITGRPAAEYRTVSDAAVASPATGIRAVFAGGMTVEELQALLESTGLRIAAGPSTSGVYTLTPASAAGDPQAALAALRSHPSVRFAEPTGQ